MVFTLMQKSSFIGTSLVTKEAQQARSAQVSTHTPDSTECQAVQPTAGIA